MAKLEGRSSGGSPVVMENLAIPAAHPNAIVPSEQAGGASSSSSRGVGPNANGLLSVEQLIAQKLQVERALE